MYLNMYLNMYLDMYLDTLIILSLDYKNCYFYKYKSHIKTI